MEKNLTLDGCEDQLIQVVGVVEILPQFPATAIELLFIHWHRGNWDTLTGIWWDMVG